jgi:hypothetical protein
MIAYIPTRGTDRLRAHLLADKLGMDFVLICDNAKQKRHIHHDFKVPKSNIVVCPNSPGPPTGAAFKRDYISCKLAAKNKWMVWLDDNVQHLTCIPYNLSTTKLDFNDKSVDWRKEFRHIATKKQVWKYANETIAYAEELGTINCGFSTDENYFFRSNKWNLWGYCRTQFSIYKNDRSGWAPTKQMMFEDMYKSVDVVARYGCVVINRHMKPIKPEFESGGIGSLEYRIPHLVNDCKWLMDTYPGLLRYSKGRDYHVTFAKRSHNTVNKWREANGY